MNCQGYSNYGKTCLEWALGTVMRPPVLKDHYFWAESPMF